LLINRSTGARVLFIATHLIPGDGTALEATRQTKTTTLFTKGHNLSESFGYPVVYAGDLNAATDTDPHFTYDSTFKPATDFGNDDAFFIAQARYNASYDSANLYKHFPPRSNDRIDRIFTAPGVGVARAGITLHLTNGQIAGVIPSDHNPVWADVYYPYAG
jgi:endonuclease/exonuclease/phosphatase family metal-dependent hydrolase